MQERNSLQSEGEDEAMSAKIREEFEKALLELEHNLPENWDVEYVAFWAARWMAERCAKTVALIVGDDKDFVVQSIRQLARELQ